jgi:hypothetical protein
MTFLGFNPFIQLMAWVMGTGHVWFISIFTALADFTSLLAWVQSFYAIMWLGGRWIVRKVVDLYRASNPKAAYAWLRSRVEKLSPIHWIYFLAFGATIGGVVAYLRFRRQKRQRESLGGFAFAIGVNVMGASVTSVLAIFGLARGFDYLIDSFEGGARTRRDRYAIMGELETQAGTIALDEGSKGIEDYWVRLKRRAFSWESFRLILIVVLGLACVYVYAPKAKTKTRKERKPEMANYIRPSGLRYSMVKVYIEDDESSGMCCGVACNGFILTQAHGLIDNDAKVIATGDGLATAVLRYVGSSGDVAVWRMPSNLMVNGKKLKSASLAPDSLFNCELVGKNVDHTKYDDLSDENNFETHTTDTTVLQTQRVGGNLQIGCRNSTAQGDCGSPVSIQGAVLAVHVAGSDQCQWAEVISPEVRHMLTNNGRKPIGDPVPRDVELDDEKKKKKNKKSPGQGSDPRTDTAVPKRSRGNRRTGRAQESSEATTIMKGCGKCGSNDHVFNACPDVTCGLCGTKGHHGNRCSEYTCKSCGEKAPGHDFLGCPKRRPQMDFSTGLETPLVSEAEMISSLNAPTGHTTEDEKSQ